MQKIQIPTPAQKSREKISKTRQDMCVYSCVCVCVFYYGRKDIEKNIL